MLVVKNLTANAADTRDLDSISGSGRFPAVGNGKPTEYSCLENFINRGAWWVAVHGVAKSWTWLSKWACMHVINYSHHGVHCISRIYFMTECLYLLTTFTHFPHPTPTFQFSSVTHLGPILQHPKDCSTPGFPVHHQLLELAQIHVHRVSDAIQASHPLLSPFPPAFNLSQHQGLFQWVRSSHQVAKVLEFQLQHQSFQWIFRTDFL